jgi:hypothetical protein
MEELAQYAVPIPALDYGKIAEVLVSPAFWIAVGCVVTFLVVVKLITRARKKDDD